MTRRDRLLALFDQLGYDEREVLLLVAVRLSLGRDVYGPLRLESDRRDFRLEALEEVADALVYSAAALVRLGAATRASNGAATPSGEGGKSEVPAELESKPRQRATSAQQRAVYEADSEESCE